jgi:hypothetical protein
MSWKSGSDIFEQIIEALLDADVSKNQRIEIYQHLIETFIDHDCDTLYQLKGMDECFDQTLKLFEDEDD